MEIINGKIKIDADEMATPISLDRRFKDEPHGVFTIGTPKGSITITNDGAPVSFKAYLKSLDLRGYGRTPFDAVLDVASPVLRGVEILV